MSLYRSINHLYPTFASYIQLLTTETTSSMTTKESTLLLLAPELRLQIYSYLLTTPSSTITTTTKSNRPLIPVTSSSKFTTHSQYRSLCVSPPWAETSEMGNEFQTNPKAPAESLLLTNHFIHNELEHYLYTTHTLFFLNAFDLDYLEPFLDNLSPTARSCIRSVGFEVYLFVHVTEGIPKRSWGQYERAERVLREKLPNWDRVVFYLDPWFWGPGSCYCSYGNGNKKGSGAGWEDEENVLARGVGFFIRAFGKGKGREMKMDFLPGSVMVGSGVGSGIRDEWERG